MNIYINGCSHTACAIHEIDSRTSWVTQLAIKLKMVKTQVFSNPSFEIFTERGTNTWIDKTQEHIERRLDKNIFTNAIDGKGNDNISFETQQIVDFLIDFDEKVDFAIIQWSGPTRRGVGLLEPREAFFNMPPPNLDKIFWRDYIEMELLSPADFHDREEEFDFQPPHLEPYASYSSLNYIYQTQEFLKSRNINYVMFNYFPIEHTDRFNFLYKKIDKSKFVTFDDSKVPIKHGWLKYIIENNLNEDLAGHPNGDGKEYIASRIFEKIDSLYGWGTKNYLV